MSRQVPFSFLRACGRYGLEALAALGYAHAAVLPPPPPDDRPEPCPTTDLSGADLSGADLSGAELITWAAIVARLDPPEQRTGAG